ncbi:hypothetical protein LDO26_14115 [Luteimonas sp. BDR2-5]|uniref:hypothetical protein n=1 Tax=Proluteimonas luteida TaxID=2878685 RepID=UPI001E3330CF|nr:hypothetical protein [Luteimonas sp. BDR2-5]MCD9029332.1 hypothetical protein [Luteimonas sp. BDR2-5]
MPIRMPMRLVFCSLLFAAALPVAARDVRLADAEGKPPCQVAAPSTTPAGNDAEGPAAALGTAKPRVPAAADSASAARPRWHSFLPGMFR